jgi:hypothetical protein
MPEILSVFRVAIVTGALVAVMEVLASALWLPLYYRCGIRVYTREIVARLPTGAPDLMEIVSCSTTGLCFHTLSVQDVAFRGPLITFTRMHVMRGWMHYDGSRVQVDGLINWTIVVIGILFFALGSMFVLHAPIYTSLLLVPVAGPLVWSYNAQRQLFDDLVV